MKRITIISVTKTLLVSAFLMAMNANVAMAFDSDGNRINAQCKSEGREPAQPYQNFNCTLCHNNGPGGGDGAGKSATKSGNIDFFCTLPVTNTAPVANAGPDQSVTSGSAVKLDGSGSSDADGDSLSYSWSLKKPSGSSASLSSTSAAMPSFTADVAGDYVISLVVSDGTDSSNADSVTITASDAPPVNTAPIADAGANQAVTTLDTVTLNGSGSSDADGDNLSYSWSMTSQPSVSSASLSGATTASPTFTADADGDYVVQLIVNDGSVDSNTDSVTITATSGDIPPVNVAPVANAGNDQNAKPGDTIQLDGSASSDANNDPLTYSWSISSAPASSTATLSDSTAEMPTFVADVTGDYVIQLIVNDGEDASAPDTVSISVNDVPTDLPGIIIRLKLNPSYSFVLDRKDVGNKAVDIKTQVVLDQDDDEVTPVLVSVTVTDPSGTVVTVLQQRRLMQRKTTILTTFTPQVNGLHIVRTTVVDESGTELSTKTRNLKVRIEEEGE